MAIVPPPEDHFQRLARLLDIEAEAVARQLTERMRRRGAGAAGPESLRGLVIASMASRASGVEALLSK